MSNMLLVALCLCYILDMQSTLALVLGDEVGEEVYRSETRGYGVSGQNRQRSVASKVFSLNSPSHISRG